MTMTIASTPLLAVDGLSVRYATDRGDVRAVEDATLRIGRGEALALIGESGSGKSTLAKALLGLLPGGARIAAGGARFHDRDGEPPVELVGIAPGRLRALRATRIAYVAQGSISGFNPLQTIGAHFDETAAAHGADRDRSRAAGRQLLEAVRLDPRRIWRAHPHELSGGTRQRVAIALALLLQPSLVVLDEPTTALDVITQRDVLTILADLREQTGVSLLFVSHDLHVAGYVADRVATMYGGRVVEDAPAAALQRQPLHPYSRGLIEAVPSLDDDVSAVAVGGNPPNLIDPPPGCAFHPRCPLAADACRAGDPPPLEDAGPDRRVACLLHGGPEEESA